MRHPHKMEELLPQEFDAERARAPVVYLPFAPVEYHGCHVSLNSDTAKGYEMCLRAAEITGGLVHPQVPIAPAGATLFDRNEIRDYMQQNSHKPSVFFSAELCKKMLLEMLDIFAEDLKFKICVLCGSHGPAGKLANIICDELNGVHKGMQLIAFGSLSHNRDIVNEENEKLGIQRTSHGGAWETAMTYACGDDFFAKDMVDQPWPEGFQNIPEEHTDGNILPTRSELRQVTKEFGDRLINTAAERVAKEILEKMQNENRQKRRELST